MHVLLKRRVLVQMRQILKKPVSGKKSYVKIAWVYIWNKTILVYWILRYLSNCRRAESPNINMTRVLYTTVQKKSGRFFSFYIINILQEEKKWPLFLGKEKIGCNFVFSKSKCSKMNADWNSNSCRPLNSYDQKYAQVTHFSALKCVESLPIKFLPPNPDKRVWIII